MGLQDRYYYREESWASPWSQAPTASQSIVTTLIVINVVIFVLDMFSPAWSQDTGWVNHFLSLKSDVWQHPWNLWQLLTHGFAHASIQSKTGIFHIGGNMLVLYFLGRPVEQRMGRYEFLKFYLIAIVVSGIGWSLVMPGNASLVGASGAISAVVAMFIFMYPHHTLLLFGIVPLKAWVLGVIVVVSDLLRSLNPASPIAWQAHLAGFAFGAACYFSKFNFHWLKVEKLAGLFKSRPLLKIHSPGKQDQDQLQQQADAILQKINEQGESSLTSRERKILTKYSEQIRRDRS